LGRVRKLILNINLLLFQCQPYNIADELYPQLTQEERDKTKESVNSQLEIYYAYRRDHQEYKPEVAFAEYAEIEALGKRFMIELFTVLIY
jgi:hypothetical protein